VIVHHSVAVCLGLSHQLFAGVIERARAAAFFADVASVGGCLFSEVASIMAATVIMTLIMLYEVIMLLIIASRNARKRRKRRGRRLSIYGLEGGRCLDPGPLA
jgi:hypothetical protein